MRGWRCAAWYFAFSYCIHLNADAINGEYTGLFPSIYGNSVVTSIMALFAAIGFIVAGLSYLINGERQE